VSIVDLHPENLLDRELRGELDATERKSLEAHLAQCATCRLERQLRADFALEMSADGLTPDLADLAEGLAKTHVEPRIAAPARRHRTKLVLLAAAATFTLVATAFASTEAGRRVLAPVFSRGLGGDLYGEASPPMATAPRAPRLRSPVALRSVASAMVDESPVLPGPSPSAAPSVAAPVAASGALPVVDGPAPLFAAETEARRRGDAARLLDLHAQLVARYPQSREAQVSRMMVARMLLERGDAVGALSGFDAYLRAGSGELREDALAGRATALDRLGRSDEGRAAWQTLLDQYPGTAYGAHARSRVEAPVGN
jgi:hypothetical protein